MNADFEEEENSLNSFGYMMLALEISLIALLWIFARDSLILTTDGQDPRSQSPSTSLP